MDMDMSSHCSQTFSTWLKDHIVMASNTPTTLDKSLFLNVLF